MRVLTCTSRFLRVSAFVTAPTSSRKKRSAFMTRTSLLTCVIEQASTSCRVLRVTLTRGLQRHADGGLGWAGVLISPTLLARTLLVCAVVQLALVFLSPSFHIRTVYEENRQPRIMNGGHLLSAHQLCLLQLLRQVDQVALVLGSACLPVGQMRPYNPADTPGFMLQTSELC